MKPAEDEADEGPLLVQRLVKLGIALAAAGILYLVGSNMFGDLLSGTRRSKLDGDYIEVSKAIKRWEIEHKKPFLEWELDKLAGSTLGNTVRDPEGREYLFDWFFRRFVYLGPDGLLQTPVPGKTPEPGDNDDEVRSLAAMERLVYARADGGGTVIELAKADGTEPTEVAKVPGPALDVAGLPTQDANLVVLTLSTTSGTQLAMVDVSKPGAPVPLTKGDFHDGAPALYAAGTEWVFFQSDMDTKTPGKTHIYKMSYKDKQPQKITSGDGQFREPAVELRSRWVWYTAGQALMRFQLASVTDQLQRMAGKPFRSPAPSASGDHLAYLLGDTLEVLDSKGKIAYTAKGVVPESRICWSPDDSKIGYLINHEGERRMVLAHVAKQCSIELPTPVVGRGFAWLHD